MSNLLFTIPVNQIPNARVIPTLQGSGPPAHNSTQTEFTFSLPFPILIESVVLRHKRSTQHLRVTKVLGKRHINGEFEPLQSSAALNAHVTDESFVVLNRRNRFRICGVARCLRIYVRGKIGNLVKKSDPHPEQDVKNSPTNEDGPSLGRLSFHQLRPCPSITIPRSESSFDFEPEWGDELVIAINGFRLDASPVNSHSITIINIATQLRNAGPSKLLDYVDAEFLGGLSLLGSRCYAQAAEMFRRARTAILKYTAQQTQKGLPSYKHRLRASTLELLVAEAVNERDHLFQKLVAYRNATHLRKVARMYEKRELKGNVVDIPKADQCRADFNSDDIPGHLRSMSRDAKLPLSLSIPSENTISTIDEASNSSETPSAVSPSPRQPLPEPKPIKLSMQSDVKTSLLRLQPDLSYLLLENLRKPLQPLCLSALKGLEFLLEHVGFGVAEQFPTILKAVLEVFPVEYVTGESADHRTDSKDSRLSGSSQGGLRVNIEHPTPMNSPNSPSHPFATANTPSNEGHNNTQISDATSTPPLERPAREYEVVCNAVDKARAAHRRTLLTGHFLRVFRVLLHLLPSFTSNTLVESANILLPFLFKAFCTSSGRPLSPQLQLRNLLIAVDQIDSKNSTDERIEQTSQSALAGQTLLGLKNFLRVHDRDGRHVPMQTGDQGPSRRSRASTSVSHNPNGEAGDPIDPNLTALRLHLLQFTAVLMHLGQNECRGLLSASCSACVLAGLRDRDKSVRQAALTCWSLMRDYIPVCMAQDLTSAISRPRYHSSLYLLSTAQFNRSPMYDTPLYRNLSSPFNRHVSRVVSYATSNTFTLPNYIYWLCHELRVLCYSFPSPASGFTDQSVSDNSGRKGFISLHTKAAIHHKRYLVSGAKRGNERASRQGRDGKRLNCTQSGHANTPMPASSSSSSSSPSGDHLPALTEVDEYGIEEGYNSQEELEDEDDDNFPISSRCQPAAFVPSVCVLLDMLRRVAICSLDGRANIISQVHNVQSRQQTLSDNILKPAQKTFRRSDTKSRTKTHSSQIEEKKKNRRGEGNPRLEFACCHAFVSAANVLSLFIESEYKRQHVLSHSLLSMLWSTLDVVLPMCFPFDMYVKASDLPTSYATLDPMSPITLRSPHFSFSLRDMDVSHSHNPPEYEDPDLARVKSDGDAGTLNLPIGDDILRTQSATNLPQPSVSPTSVTSEALLPRLMVYIPRPLTEPPITDDIGGADSGYDRNLTPESLALPVFSFVDSPFARHPSHFRPYSPHLMNTPSTRSSDTNSPFDDDGSDSNDDDTYSAIAGHPVTAINHFIHPIIAIATHFCQHSSPGVELLKSLCLILPHANPRADPGMTRRLLSLFSRFCQWIPHSVFDETFDVFKCLLNLLKHQIPNSLFCNLVRAMLSRYTVRSNAQQQAMAVLMDIVLENPRHYFPSLLELCLFKVNCPVRLPNGIAGKFRVGKHYKQLHLQGLQHEMDKELISLLVQCLHRAAKQFHSLKYDLFEHLDRIVNACSRIIRHSSVSFRNDALSIMVCVTHSINAFAMESKNKARTPPIFFGQNCDSKMAVGLNGRLTQAYERCFNFLIDSLHLSSGCPIPTDNANESIGTSGQEAARDAKCQIKEAGLVDGCVCLGSIKALHWFFSFPEHPHLPFPEKEFNHDPSNDSHTSTSESHVPLPFSISPSTPSSPALDNDPLTLPIPGPTSNTKIIPLPTYIKWMTRAWHLVRRAAISSSWKQVRITGMWCLGAWGCWIGALAFVPPTVTSLRPTPSRPPMSSPSTSEDDELPSSPTHLTDADALYMHNRPPVIETHPSEDHDDPERPYTTEEAPLDLEFVNIGDSYIRTSDVLQLQEEVLDSILELLCVLNSRDRLAGLRVLAATLGLTSSSATKENNFSNPANRDSPSNLDSSSCSDKKSSDPSSPLPSPFIQAPPTCRSNISSSTNSTSTVAASDPFYLLVHFTNHWYALEQSLHSLSHDVTPVVRFSSSFIADHLVLSYLPSLYNSTLQSSSYSTRRCPPWLYVGPMPPHKLWRTTDPQLDPPDGLCSPHRGIPYNDVRLQSHYQKRARSNSMAMVSPSEAGLLALTVDSDNPSPTSPVESLHINHRRSSVAGVSTSPTNRLSRNSFAAVTLSNAHSNLMNTACVALQQTNGRDHDLNRLRRPTASFPIPGSSHEADGARYWSSISDLADPFSSSHFRHLLKRGQKAVNHSVGSLTRRNHMLGQDLDDGLGEDADEGLTSMTLYEHLSSWQSQVRVTSLYRSVDGSTDAVESKQKCTIHGPERGQGIPASSHSETSSPSSSSASGNSSSSLSAPGPSPYSTSKQDRAYAAERTGVSMLLELVALSQDQEDQTKDDVASKHKALLSEVKATGVDGTSNNPHDRSNIDDPILDVQVNIREVDEEGDGYDEFISNRSRIHRANRSRGSSGHSSSSHPSATDNTDSSSSDSSSSESYVRWSNYDERDEAVSRPRGARVRPQSASRRRPQTAHAHQMRLDPSEQWVLDQSQNDGNNNNNHNNRNSRSNNNNNNNNTDQNSIISTVSRRHGSGRPALTTPRGTRLVDGFFQNDDASSPSSGDTTHRQYHHGHDPTSPSGRYVTSPISSRGEAHVGCFSDTAELSLPQALNQPTPKNADKENSIDDRAPWSDSDDEDDNGGDLCVVDFVRTGNSDDHEDIVLLDDASPVDSEVALLRVQERRLYDGTSTSGDISPKSESSLDDTSGISSIPSGRLSQSIGLTLKMPRNSGSIRTMTRDTHNDRRHQGTGLTLNTTNLMSASNRADSHDDSSSSGQDDILSIPIESLPQRGRIGSMVVDSPSSSDGSFGSDDGIDFVSSTFSSSSSSSTGLSLSRIIDNGASTSNQNVVMLDDPFGDQDHFDRTNNDHGNIQSIESNGFSSGFQLSMPRPLFSSGSLPTSSSSLQTSSDSSAPVPLTGSSLQPPDGHPVASRSRASSGDSTGGVNGDEEGLDETVTHGYTIGQGDDTMIRRMLRQGNDEKADTSDTTQPIKRHVRHHSIHASSSSSSSSSSSDGLPLHARSHSGQASSTGLSIAVAMLDRDHTLVELEQRCLNRRAEFIAELGQQDDEHADRPVSTTPRLSIRDLAGVAEIATPHAQALLMPHPLSNEDVMRGDEFVSPEKSPQSSSQGSTTQSPRDPLKIFQFGDAAHHSESDTSSSSNSSKSPSASSEEPNCPERKRAWSSNNSHGALGSVSPSQRRQLFTFPSTATILDDSDVPQPDTESQQE